MNFFKSKRKVSLVLGSGGARGLVQIGVIKMLLQKGYVIDEIVGCSIGSLIGAAYAQGKLDELEEWLKGVTKMKVFQLMDFSNPWFGILKGTKALDSLKLVFPDIAIEELPIRYVAIATDLRNECEVVFDTGSVYDAIRASIAIPAVFTGVDSEGRYLVDGGVLNPLPINYVKKSRRNLVVVVNLDGRPDPEVGEVVAGGKYTSLTVLQEAYFAMRRRLSQLSIDMHKPDYVITVPHNTAGIWDYHRTLDLVEKGMKWTDLLLPDANLKRKKAPVNS
ncbi:patatin-like phospholipase family protein [Sphingobacterium chungjuense]|uniref:patatin-like phospholipase family protein n=1 Tax=Sphingobacterium chungjuense TaxID=2675553 RepID=UPI001F10C902|nr:patatin-like phospholipase family protein [Sphingobacterium chungjuense]